MVFQAKDIMDRDPLTVDEEIDALACARKMVAARKGYAVLTRGGANSLAGIATEWDFLEKIVAAGGDPTRIRMKEIASGNVQSCPPDAPTDEVVTRMATLGIRRMIVRSGDRVVGVITSRNVFAMFRPYIDRLSADIAARQSPPEGLG